MKTLTKTELTEFHSALKEFTDGLKWKRDLTPCEKRVNFKDIDDKITAAEDLLAEQAGAILKQMVDKAIKDVEKILESGKPAELQGLKDIKIAYVGKYTNLIQQILQDLVICGAAQVKDEQKIEGNITIPNSTRQWIAAKAEAIASRHAQMIKQQVIFGALSGVDADKTTKQIIWDIRQGAA